MADEIAPPNPEDVPEENRFTMMVYADGFVSTNDEEESN